MKCQMRDCANAAGWAITPGPLPPTPESYYVARVCDADEARARTTIPRHWTWHREDAQAK